MCFYNFIDAPVKSVDDLNSRRHKKRNNRPRKIFLRLEDCLKEAQRLANKTKKRVLTLQVIQTTEPQDGA